MVVYIILAVVLCIFAGISKGITDVTSFHFDKSIFVNKPLFWNPLVSWKNKYKDGDKNKGAKFLGSTTIFVLFTDGWHLFGFLERIFLCAAFIFIGLLIAGNLWFLFGALIGYIIFFLTFHLFFTTIFIKK